MQRPSLSSGNGSSTSRSMQSRIILFVAIVGLAMIVAAFFFAAVPDETDPNRTAQNLRATAAALDERATEIAVAATRILQGLPAPAATPDSPGLSLFGGDSSGSTSRDAPVPLGESWTTPDGLRIRVLSVDFDAWPRVLAENQFNDPPGDGMRMVMAEVEVTNLDRNSRTPRAVDDSDYRVVGDRGIIYTTFDTPTRCGVIPNELDWEVFPDATVTGNICVIAPQDETELRLIYKPGYDWGDQVVYFDLAD